jgi:hypothetical protein
MMYLVRFDIVYWEEILPPVIFELSLLLLRI